MIRRTTTIYKRRTVQENGNLSRLLCILAAAVRMLQNDENQPLSAEQNPLRLRPSSGFLYGSITTELGRLDGSFSSSF
jgi:hypothetical protein